MIQNKHLKLISKIFYFLLLTYTVIYGFNKYIILFLTLLITTDIRLLVGLVIVILYRGFIINISKNKTENMTYIDLSKYDDLIKINNINVKDYVLKDILVEYKKLMGNEFKPPSETKKY